MKGFKKIILWTLIPITLELLGIFYIDQFYLNDETSFNTKKIDVATKKGPNKINVKVGDEAKNIKASYNGKYISYYEDESIKVIDTSNNKKKEITFEDGGKLSSYKWLPDRDIMLVAEKYSNGNLGNYLKFKSYNAKKDEKLPLSDENNKELKIPLLDGKYEVLDIALSTATNVTYVKVGREGVRSKLYRINVMAQLEETKYYNGKLGEITALNKEDRLVYQDVTYNRIRVVGLKNPIATGENAIHYLLASDSEDNVYIGNGEDEKVKKIFVASLKKPRDQWKILTLEERVNKDNIYITNKGKIYINEPSKSLVKDLESGQEVQYEGEVVEIHDFGIIVKDGGKISGKLF
ncbi:hypothetical protein P8V03_01205 [Clostridium sp. A1-XYC3]|uniref:Dipeptidyl-peptidase IV n=1 Tax=Clostridium tanneri TaxID=3037988 RepID=A0ABU4JNS9_9CLOT|nr:hypothetical protein [Clostridium sp. A1-XYC3]MDW8799770.1 hypothetical protein [Clostridium sp. A1-XYC3]